MKSTFEKHSTKDVECYFYTHFYPQHDVKRLIFYAINSISVIARQKEHIDGIKLDTITYFNPTKRTVK